MAVDPLGPRLQLIADCLEHHLDAYAVPVCRLFIHPGAVAPWDVCGESGGAEGQAWVAVQRVAPVPDERQPRISTVEYAATVQVGILRCAATQDSEGRPPSAEAVTADALKQTRDMAILRDVLDCCVRQGLGAEPGEFALGLWQPLGPEGGCVGGQWQATFMLPACPCPEWDG